MSSTFLAAHRLSNGLELVFTDRGNRYFGDYHQVRVDVSCRIPLGDELCTERLVAEDLEKARKIFGDHVEYRRQLRQMGVAGADVASVRQALVDSFMANSAPYMQGADFASRYVARRLAEHRSRSRLHLVGRD